MSVCHRVTVSPLCAQPCLTSTYTHLHWCIRVMRAKALSTKHTYTHSIDTHNGSIPWPLLCYQWTDEFIKAIVGWCCEAGHMLMGLKRWRGWGKWAVRRTREYHPTSATESWSSDLKTGGNGESGEKEGRVREARDGGWRRVRTLLESNVLVLVAQAFEV